MAEPQPNHVQYETNIDDMDPRLWPEVIAKLLEVGADDAWVTPIVMKKGRPAFTLGVLCDASLGKEIRSTIYAETTTLGIREVPVTKYVLDRKEESVEVDGQTISVKSAYDNGQLLNRSVEWDDVVAAAKALGRPAKDVLAEASAQAHQLP